MTDCLAFVTGVSTDPTAVRVNLDDDVVWALQVDDWQLGMPEMKRVTVGTMLRDGEVTPASAYGNREITFTIKSLKDNRDEAATDLQKVMRELDRPTNWLRWTPPGATNPIFFKTFRTAAGSVKWDEVDLRATITVPADSAGLGVMETAVAGVTVSNNPAGGGNACFLNLTGVKGDLETPLFMEYTGGASGGTFPGLVMGLRSGASPYPTVFRQAEGLALSTDTTSVADATYSGGNKARVSFSTSTAMVQRLSGIFPASSVPAGAENVGTYRVFARCAKTVGGDVVKLRMTSNAGLTFEPEQAAPSIPGLMDLGILSVHTARPRSAGFGPAAYRAENLPTVVVQAQRVSGSGSLDIDYLMLLPADEAVVNWRRITGSASTAVLDGPNKMAYGASSPTGSTPGLYDGQPAGVNGGFPMLKPGDNHLVLGVWDTALATGNDISTNLTVTIRYWPRYLYVQPVGT